MDKFRFKVKDNTVYTAEKVNDNYKISWIEDGECISTWYPNEKAEKYLNDDIWIIQGNEPINSNEKTAEIPFKRYKELLKVEAKFLQLKKILESMKEREV
jgi:hypothetical protein